MIARRRRQQRNFLATLLLSQGVPMLLGGDEIGRTQHGNNNAYCQDNEISWFDWEDLDEPLLAFTRQLMALRRSHPSFHRRRWFQGQLRGRVDIDWFRPDGEQMTDEDWRADFVRSVGIFLNGEAIAGRDPRGQRVTDDSFALLFNAHDEPIEWRLPHRYAKSFETVLVTLPDPLERDEARDIGPDDAVTVQGRSVVLLRATLPGEHCEDASATATGRGGGPLPAATGRPGTPAVATAPHPRSTPADGRADAGS